MLSLEAWSPAPLLPRLLRRHVRSALTMTAPTSMAGMGTIPPPAGVAPNFVNPPHNAAPDILAGIMMPIAVLFVCMRVFTRIVLLRGFGWDDGKPMLPSIRLSLADSFTATCVIATVCHGHCNHIASRCLA